MSPKQILFKVDEVERLRAKMRLLGEETNLLRQQVNGQASGWSGIPLGGDVQRAQQLIQQLTADAEKFEEVIRGALRGVERVQEENRRSATQLGQQLSGLGGLFGSLGMQNSGGRIPIPTFAQKMATNLIQQIAVFGGWDELNQDPVVRRLRGIVKQVGIGTAEKLKAQSRLNEIFATRDLIAKSQKAYGVYKSFGNQGQMEAVHKLAEEARKKLEAFGVDAIQYQAGKDVSGYFKRPVLQACDYDPSITSANVPLVQNESYLLLLRMAMEKGDKGDWAKSQLAGKRLDIKMAEAARLVEAQMEAEKRLNGPPMELPDGIPITPYNKDNDTTLAYFLDKVYDPKAQLTVMATAYYMWLEETYGMTEWRKKVVQADKVAMAFSEALIVETVMGVVGTAKLTFNFVVDPKKTTQEMADKAYYLIEHPEVLVEAARTIYNNFDEGTPEQKAAMLGSVASNLVPGLTLTKSAKVAKLVNGGQELVTKGMHGVKDIHKVLQNSEHFPRFPNLNPLLITPEGIPFKVGDFAPDTNPLPKTSVQEHYIQEMDGLGNGRDGGIEGTGNGDHPIRTYRNADLSELEAKYTADPRLTVEMPYVGKGKNGTNSEGWLRDKDYYWKEVMDKYPESISKANKQKIELGFSPINDKQFREHFPQFNIKELNNDTLIHHHIGGGGQAVAVPSKLHPGSGGIHNAEKEAGIWGSDSQYAELLEKYLNK